MECVQNQDIISKKKDEKEITEKENDIEEALYIIDMDSEAMCLHDFQESESTGNTISK